MTLSYDGHNLESLFICGDPELSILNSQPDIANTESRNGAMFLGMRYDVSTVSFTIVATGSASERRDKFSTLGDWLMVSSPRKLILPDTPDRYYAAVPQGALELQRGFDAEYAKLTFTLTDPIAFSNTLSSATSTDGVADMTIGGTAPTYITVTANSAIPDGNNLWGVSRYSNVFTGMAADIGASTTGRKVVINSEQRSFAVAGSLKFMTLSSEWTMLEPGTRQLYRTYGTGEFTVQWRDRWY